MFTRTDKELICQNCEAINYESECTKSDEREPGDLFPRYSLHCRCCGSDNLKEAEDD